MACLEKDLHSYGYANFAIGSTRLVSNRHAMILPALPASLQIQNAAGVLCSSGRLTREDDDVVKEQKQMLKRCELK